MISDQSFARRFWPFRLVIMRISLDGQTCFASWSSFSAWKAAVSVISGDFSNAVGTVTVGVTFPVGDGDRRLTMSFFKTGGGLPPSFRLREALLLGLEEVLLLRLVEEEGLPLSFRLGEGLSLRLAEGDLPRVEERPVKP